MDPSFLIFSVAAIVIIILFLGVFKKLLMLGIVLFLLLVGYGGFLTYEGYSTQEVKDIFSRNTSILIEKTGDAKNFVWELFGDEDQQTSAAQE